MGPKHSPPTNTLHDAMTPLTELDSAEIQKIVDNLHKDLHFEKNVQLRKKTISEFSREDLAYFEDLVNSSAGSLLCKIDRHPMEVQLNEENSFSGEIPLLLF